MKMGNMIIYSLSLENNRTTRIREATIFDSSNQPDVAISIFPGNFAVSGTTFYAEYDKKLFKWKPGTTEWHNTGLIDAGEAGFFEEFTDILDSTSFQLAVSGSKVYVGKRDLDTSCSRSMKGILGTTSRQIYHSLLSISTILTLQGQPFM